MSLKIAERIPETIRPAQERPASFGVALRPERSAWLNEKAPTLPHVLDTQHNHTDIVPSETRNRPPTLISIINNAEEHQLTAKFPIDRQKAIDVALRAYKPDAHDPSTPQARGRMEAGVPSHIDQTKLYHDIKIQSIASFDTLTDPEIVRVDDTLKRRLESGANPLSAHYEAAKQLILKKWKDKDQQIVHAAQDEAANRSNHSFDTQSHNDLADSSPTPLLLSQEGLDLGDAHVNSWRVAGRSPDIQSEGIEAINQLAGYPFDVMVKIGSAGKGSRGTERYFGPTRKLRRLTSVNNQDPPRQQLHNELERTRRVPGRRPDQQKDAVIEVFHRPESQSDVIVKRGSTGRGSSGTERYYSARRR